MTHSRAIQTLLAAILSVVFFASQVRPAQAQAPTPPTVTETVYVADPANQEIFEFFNGKKNAVATSFSGATGNVTGIARHSSGFIFGLDAAGTASLVKSFDAQLGLAGEIPLADLPLKNPVGIAMDSNNDVFVGDNLAASLVVYELPAVSASGTPGGSKVTFTLPATKLPAGSQISGVSVNSGGKYLYVSTNTLSATGAFPAQLHSNVSIFSVAKGTLVKSFDVTFPYEGEGGADAVGIAGDANGNSYVVYSSTGIVSTGLLQVWSLTGVRTTTLGTPDDITMNAVALDSSGEVVSINGYELDENFGDNTPRTVARETKAGAGYEALVTNGMKNPSGIVGAPAFQSSGLRLYAADNSVATATGYNGPLSSSTTAAYTFNLPNILNGEIGHQSAYGIAIDPTDPNGTIYVSSTDTVYEATEIDAFARPTATGSYSPIQRISSGLLSYEGQIAFDQDGDLFIPAQEVISPTAEVVERIHGSGFANSYQPIIVMGLSFPQCVAVDRAGDLFVLDQIYTGTQYEDTLYEYTPSAGAYSQTPSHTVTDLSFEASCAYDAVLDEVFVTDRTDIVGYDNTLAVKRTITPALSAGTFLNGLGFDPAGTLYLGTTANTIVVIPPANFTTGTPTVTFNSTGGGFASAVAQIVIGD